MRGKSARGSSARSSRRRGNRVFLNVPFDNIRGYEHCFLAYVAGIVGLGLAPRSVVEIPSGGRDRLTRIFRLMRDCRYSLHDLSRIELRAGRYPRFNMPFELGLATALALARRPSHDRYVFAPRHHVVHHVASDLGGVDVYEHKGSAPGVLVSLNNAFVRRTRPADVRHLATVYRKLKAWADQNCRRARPRRSVYEPAVFKRLVIVATAVSREARKGTPAAR